MIRESDAAEDFSILASLKDLVVSYFPDALPSEFFTETETAFTVASGKSPALRGFVGGVTA